jgi:NADPH2:quinone reductase
MRAILCKDWDGPDGLVLEDIEPAAPGPGELRVAVKAAALNFADSLMTAGKYQLKPPLPFSPCFEAAGVVLEVGAGVTKFKPGDRVVNAMQWGALAEQCVTVADRTYPIPDALDFETAAAFPVIYGTSHIALERRGQLQAGETLLVHGATSGVGLAAIEIGKAMGARVIAAARGPEKCAVAKSVGADEVIDATAEDIRERVKAMTDGAGADVIYDPIGGDAFDVSLRCINWGGRILIVGFAAGRISQIPANILLVKNAAAIGVFWNSHFEREPEVLAESFKTLLTWHGEGKLKPLIREVVPLERFSDAFSLLLDRQAPGKIVVRVAA